MSPHALAERVRGGERLELADDVAVPPELQLGRDLLLDGLQAQLLEPGDVASERGLAGQVGQGRPSPQAERLGERDLGRPRLQGAVTRLAKQPLEPDRVHLVGVGVEEVPGGPALDRVGPQRGPQARDVDLERRLGILGELLPPDGVDQLLGRNDLVRGQHQVGEHDPLLRAPERDRAVTVGDLERSEDPETHGPTVRSSRRLRNPSDVRPGRAHAWSLRRPAFSPLTATRLADAESQRQASEGDL